MRAETLKLMNPHYYKQPTREGILSGPSFMLLSPSVPWPTDTERNDQAQNMEVMQHSTFLTFSRCSNISDSKSRASPLCANDKEAI